MKLQKPPSCKYIPKCIFLFQVEPRVLFSKRIPSTFCLFVFETFDFGNSLFVSRLLALFGTIHTKKKLHVQHISQRVITSLVKRTSGEENYSFSEFFTCPG